MAQVMGTFAVAPGNVLDDDPMFGARHPPGCVAKEGRDPPQGHKQPTPLGQAVIARRGPLAARATPAYPRMRFHGDQDRLRPALLAMHAHLLVYKAGETLHAIQDGLNL